MKHPDNIKEDTWQGIGRLFVQFCHSELANKELTPSQWLSVVDLATKFGGEQLADFGIANFYDTFDWSEIESTKEDTGSAG